MLISFPPPPPGSTSAYLSRVLQIITQAFSSLVSSTQASASVQLQAPAGKTYQISVADDGHLVSQLNPGKGTLIPAAAMSFINAADYAVGDADTTGGGTDDTAALQNILTALETAGGGPDVILTKRFRITSPLTYTGAYLRIRGGGPRTGIINDSATGNALQISGSGECIELSNFEIRNNDSLTPTAGTAISVTGTGGIAKYQNLSLRNNFNSLSIVGTSAVSTINYPVLSDIDIRACRGTGINLSNTLGPRLRTILISGVGAQGKALVVGDGVQDIDADQISTELFTVSVNVNSSVAAVQANFRRCTFDAASAVCCDIEQGNIVNFSECLISSTLAGAWGASVGSVGTNLVTFDNCDFLNMARYGIVIQATALNTAVVNCRLYGCGLDTANTYDAVEVLANTNKFKLLGNTITNTTPFTGTQRYGIVVNGGTSDEYVITDNYLRGNATGGLFDGGSGANKLVTDNLS